MKFIYWFAYFNTKSPSVRYRGQYTLDYFKEAHGVKSALIIPGYRIKSIYCFLKYYLEALIFRKKDSLIVIQRVHSSFIYASLLKLLVVIRKKGTIYDLDDGDYLYCPPKTIHFFARNCEFVSAGSQEIKDYLSAFNDKIVLTTSPTPNLNIVKDEIRKPFVIGWVGWFGGDHKKSMIDIVFPAIKKLDFECKFVIMGVKTNEEAEFIHDYFFENKNIIVDTPLNIDWLNEQKVQYAISEFSVGIATLVNNEVQRAKSGIKAKQYLNNGIPVLGTNLPENNRVIKDGSNGYFCDTTEDFVLRINEFYEMSEERFGSFSITARLSIKEFNRESFYKAFRTMAS